MEVGILPICEKCGCKSAEYIIPHWPYASVCKDCYQKYLESCIDYEEIKKEER